MTDKAKLLELAAACEAATGPDRELDVQIACFAPICTADYVLSAQPSAKQGMVTRYFDGGGHGTFVCDNYTRSLDAAMSLVPEGFGYSICPGSVLLTRSIGGRGVMARAATPALALVAAALRAIAENG